MSVPVNTTLAPQAEQWTMVSSGNSSCVSLRFSVEPIEHPLEVLFFELGIGGKVERSSRTRNNHTSNLAGRC